MKCYNHHDRDAFAVCRACGKALCLECMEETAGLIHCKSSANCKEIAKTSEISYDVMRKGYSSSRINGLKAIGFIFSLIGVIAVILGFIRPTGIDFGMVVGGFLFLIIGFANYVQTHKLPTIKDKNFSLVQVGIIIIVVVCILLFLAAFFIPAGR